MWVRFTFITGPWIRPVVLPSPWMPPCNVPGICCSGIVVFLVYTCVFSQTFKQGAGCFTNGSREWCCSYWGWEAFAFWVLRELRAGRGIYPHEQNIVVSASRDTLNFSVFLCLVSWLLVCSALILGHFLGRMEIWVLLCPTWSDLPAGHGAAVGCGGTGELRAKMPTAAELSGQKDGFRCRHLLLMSMIHTVLLCAWSVDGSGPYIEEVVEIYEHNLPTSRVSGICDSFCCYCSQSDYFKSQHFLKPLQAVCSSRYLVCNGYSVGQQ